MALPKIDLPVYDLTIPSTQKVVQVRPFTVKEEKLLLIALESKVPADIIATVKQVINNCVIEGKIEVDKLPFFDVDYIFIFLRAKSVGETVDVNLTCNNVLENGEKCDNVFSTEMDLSKVELVKDSDIKDDITLSGASGIRMRYPDYSVMRRIDDLPEIDKKTEIIINSIDYIYNKDGMHSHRDYTRDELKEFVEGLTEEGYRKLEQYVDSFPEVAAVLDAKCNKCGFEHKVRYTEFLDFFI